jgi:phage recombination protein Bet
MSAAESTLAKAGAQQTLIGTMAEKYGVDASSFYNTITSTIFTAGKAKQGSEPKPGRGLPPTKEQVMTFLVVANQYDLNPFLKEIYPFIDGEGNLKIIVGIDGWIKVALRHKNYSGHEFQDHTDAEGKLYAVTCSIYRNDRDRAIKMVEYMVECKRESEPWKQWPHRMLHHKAFIQTARYALGMGDLVDEDELDRINSVQPAFHAIEEPRRISETAKPAIAASTVQTHVATSESGIPRAQIPQGDVMETRDELLDADDIKKLNEAIYARGLSKADFNDWLESNPALGAQRMAGLHKRQLVSILAALPNIPKK